MFVIKNKYFLIIESIKDIDLSNIKNHRKFIIIYRSKPIKDKINDLIQFRKKCKSRKIKFYVANNLKLCVLTKSDGIYLSSHNRSYKVLNFKRPYFDIIGSAHNIYEINFKLKQGCNFILLSKLFLVNYDKESPYLGVLKFNNFLKISKKLIPLGGINSQNLNKLKNVICEGFAIFSEIKKKPTKIFSRLF